MTMEFTAGEAPAHYGAEEAEAWAVGRNAGVALLSQGEAVPAITARSFETAVMMAIESATASGDTVMLMFDDIAVQVDPGDDRETVTINYDHTVGLLKARLLGDRQLLSERGRTPMRGDLVETVEDDYNTRIMKGSGGIVTEVEHDECDKVCRIVVRFARRTDDYIPVDFQTLRYIR